VTIYEVLADPTRRRILDLLRARPRLVGELAELLQTSQPGVSKHLRMLREAGLVSVRQDAQRRWEARLDRLDHLLTDVQAHEREQHNDESHAPR
jgi:DNA-binding transcriptional ArsR family regulator